MNEVSIDWAIKRLKALPSDINRGKVRAMETYVKEMLVNHFKKGNTWRYKYKPNTPQYEAWKKKVYGDLPQLVVSGELRNRCLEGKVNFRGELLIDLPKQGIYQLNMGRDFLSPNSTEAARMRKILKLTVAQLARSRNRFKI
jgi:hypothetical protein